MEAYRMKGRNEWVVRAGVTSFDVLHDVDLSFRAKGIFAYLDAPGGGARRNLTELIAASEEQSAAVRTALGELEDSGYVARQRVVEEFDEEAALVGSRGAAHVMESLFGEEFAPTVKVDALRSAEGLGARATKSRERIERDEIVGRVFARINELREKNWTWTRYTPLDRKSAKNADHIRRLLKLGHSEEELLLILDYRAERDAGDVRSRKYFNGDTPFNTRNFDHNLAEARDWDARGRPRSGRHRPRQATGAVGGEIYERTIKGGESD